MHAKPPCTKMLAAFGMKQEDFDTDVIEVWEENAASWDVFSQLSTQWRIGMNGPTGLDYNAALAVINFSQHTDKKQLFEDVRTMERAALEQMSDNRANDSD